MHQGESFEQAVQLDEFQIGPIPPRPKGEPNVEVEMELDQDGILQVSAEDVDHQVGEAIQIESMFGHSREELDAMQQNLPAIKE